VRQPEAKLDLGADLEMYSLTFVIPDSSFLPLDSPDRYLPNQASRNSENAEFDPAAAIAKLKCTSLGDHVMVCSAVECQCGEDTSMSFGAAANFPIDHYFSKGLLGE